MTKIDKEIVHAYHRMGLVRNAKTELEALIYALQKNLETLKEGDCPSVGVMRFQQYLEEVQKLEFYNYITDRFTLTGNETETGK